MIHFAYVPLLVYLVQRCTRKCIVMILIDFTDSIVTEIWSEMDISNHLYINKP